MDNFPASRLDNSMISAGKTLWSLRTFICQLDLKNSYLCVNNLVSALTLGCTTQIIKMKEELKYVPYLEWTLLIVVFFGIAFFSKEFDFVENLKPITSIEKYIMLIGLFIIAFIVLGVHELGHLIIGLMNGFRFELFVVGPLGIKRENDEIKVYLNKNLAHYGGLAATSPIGDNDDNADKFAKVLLAGPIASVLFAIVCFVIAYCAGRPLGIIFYAGGLTSIAIFLVTTIPSKTGMFFTDRKRYQRLVNPGKDQKVELAMLRIMGRYSKDNSYKNINKNDIYVLISDTFPFIKYFGLFNLVCFQLENNGVVDEETSRDYEHFSKNMSKNLVSAFNKEIEKFKERLKTESK